MRSSSGGGSVSPSASLSAAGSQEASPSARLAPAGSGSVAFSPTKEPAGSPAGTLVNQNQISFTTIDVGKEESLRFLLIIPGQLSAPESWSSIESGSINLLRSSVFRTESFNSIADYRDLLGTQGLKYSFLVKGFPAEEYTFKCNLIGFSVTQNNLCILIAGAPQNSFNEYRGEFFEFFENSLKGRYNEKTGRNR